MWKTWFWALLNNCHQDLQNIVLLTRSIGWTQSGPGAKAVGEIYRCPYPPFPWGIFPHSWYLVALCISLVIPNSLVYFRISRPELSRGAKNVSTRLNNPLPHTTTISKWMQAKRFHSPPRQRRRFHGQSCWRDLSFERHPALGRKLLTRSIGWRRAS